MSWTVTVSRDFLKDLVGLPAKTRKRLEDLVFNTLPNLDDPFSLPNLKKLQGYQSFYRIRLGDYRLGLEIDPTTKRIAVLRILHRRDIYRHFP